MLEQRKTEDRAVSFGLLFYMYPFKCFNFSKVESRIQKLDLFFGKRKLISGGNWIYEVIAQKVLCG